MDGYISDVELQESPVENSAPLSRGAPPEKKTFGDAGKEGAATIGQSIVSVVAALDGLNRTDVSNCLEFASRVANFKVKADPGSEKWWNEYTASVGQLGWFGQGRGMTKADIMGITTGDPTFSDYIIQIVSEDAAFGNEEKAVIIASLNALTKQGNQKGALFRSFSADREKSTFSVAVATVKNGALALRMIGFHFKASETVTDCLIFKIRKSSVEVYQEILDFGANQGTIDANREKITQKLAGATGDYIDGAVLG